MGLGRTFKRPIFFVILNMPIRLSHPPSGLACLCYNLCINIKKTPVLLFYDTRFSEKGEQITMPVYQREVLTAREVTEHEWNEQAMKDARAHAVYMREMDINMLEKQSRINIWFKIPVLIILLPVKIVCAIALIVSYARKHEPSDNFWKALGW